MHRHLKIECRLENLKEIRSFIQDNLQTLAINELEQNLMVVAIDEMCANLIIHANERDESKFIHVGVQPLEDGVIFELKDNGHSFDPSSYIESSLTEVKRLRRKGGLGLSLVRRIMDKIEYVQSEDCNVCLLYKKLNLYSQLSGI
ncbi:serine/threonine-protein kinase RsbW [Catalinimonas alkaloidigena]|uniref:Serine/threonine-protein kinase RsbW n=1 Tax=Catalinimonas alkaloidigena TaxID=1075417 RepID=A0A1G9NEU7_9BACT|nr:ATP-binding protein [Catalinimonas alkaloidigena]SDL85022.1 serine/threonine-protein kinase RsbW [Catalinimonas alkaloidigena]